MPLYKSDPTLRTSTKTLPKNNSNFRVAVSHTADKNSFAYSTVRERWPKIITSTMEDVKSTLDMKDRTPEEVKDGEGIVQKLQQLLTDMAEDAQLQPIPDDGGPDIPDYNTELQELGSLSWHNAPWLYLECYLYRLLHTFFSTSSTPFWATYDPFAHQKDSSLPASRTGTVELVTAFLQTLEDMTGYDMDDSIRHDLLEEMLQISLWGNATDLSLLTTLSMSELHSRQGQAARQASKQNVIVDDTEAVWELFEGMLKSGGGFHDGTMLKSGGGSGPSEERKLDIVLDNSGFELLTDLVLAVFLLKARYATQITLHGKSIPWFVSDVTARDLSFLITSLVAPTHDTSLSSPPPSPSPFGPLSPVETTALSTFGTLIQSLLASQALTYKSHTFWTTAHPFSRLPERAPALYTELCNAQLVVFKGDLNYRKLVGDGMWPKTTGFRVALGDLGAAGALSQEMDDDGRAKKKEKGLRILALRGCKADVVVGLKEGQEEALAEADGKGWTRTGKYAVISYCDGKGGDGIQTKGHLTFT